MAFLIDSNAHFVKRCKEINLSVQTINRLDSLGLKSLGQIAHVVGSPGQPLPEEDLRDWTSANLPNLSVGDAASLKRILFEAQTLVLAQLRQTVADPDNISRQKLPDAELEQRAQLFKNSNPGLFLDSTMEPGHSLVELAAAQEKSNVLKYITVDQSVSRQHEILNQKNPSKVLALEGGSVTVREERQTSEQPTSGALSVLEALTRRGYALSMANMVTLTVYQKYLAKLMSHFRRNPPPNHQRVTLQQILEADKAVWLYMVEQGLKPKDKLDQGLHEALASYQVAALLLPMQAGTKRKQQSPKRTGPSKHSRTPKSSKGQGKGSKGKTPSNSSKGEQVVPDAIRNAGGKSRTAKGLQICYAFNLQGCRFGSKCSRHHVCAKCEGSHSLQDCPQKS